MNIYCKQIDKVCSKFNIVIIMGDANLCSEKWGSPNFEYKSIAEELINTLEQCGLKARTMGKTYTADGASPDESIAMTSIDHI